MRGFDQSSDALCVYLSPESFVPKDHPLRPIRQMVDTALENLSPGFGKMYSHTGRSSIPPERLLKAMLLQVLYSIPSNVKLVEQIHFNLLFRWFLGLGKSGITQVSARIRSALFKPTSPPSFLLKCLNRLNEASCFPRIISALTTR